MTVQEPLAGTVLGSFRVERRLGEGGIGAVYAATHTRTGRRYAVKVLLPEMAMKEGAIERFRREAEALAALGHAGIVAIHDFDHAADGTQFLVMDLLEGEDLATRLERDRSLPVVDALRIADDIGVALAAAHAVGIVHRDLKPANIFLAQRPGAAEHATILDFGLAKNVRAEERVRLTVTGAGLGTPLYMSPEQARGLEVDQRTDVYSLGCIVYEMLAGAPPFEAATLTAVIAKILGDPPPLLSARAPQPVPAALDGVLQAALAKDPAARPESAEALLAALHAAAGTRGTTSDARLRPTSQTAGLTATSAPSGPIAPSTFRDPTRPGSGPILATAAMGLPDLRGVRPYGLADTRPSVEPAATSRPESAVAARASGEGRRPPPFLALGLGAVALVALVAGAVGVGMAMGSSTDARSGQYASTVTVTAGRQPITPVTAQPVVAPTRVGGGHETADGLGTPSPPAPNPPAGPPAAPAVAPSHPSVVESPHATPRGAHAERTPTQRIADAVERQVAAEHQLAVTPPPPPTVAELPPNVAAQIERGRIAQRAAADNATRLAHAYETALGFFVPLRTQLRGTATRQRPAFCTDATRGRLDAMARGEDDTESLVAQRADALREAIGPLCDSFDHWDTPPPEARDGMHRLQRDLDDADRMLRDVEANRQGQAEADQIRAAVADVRVVFAHAEPSGRRFPCDSPEMTRLRDLQRGGSNGWADSAAGDVVRSEEGLCRTLGVHRQQLESETRRVSNVLDGTESALRDNIRSQRDIAAQFRAAADGVVP